MIKNKEYIQFEDLDNFKDIIHFYSKKPFDFNLNHSSSSKINEYFSMYESLLDYSCIKRIKPNQTHTNNVEIVNHENIESTFNNIDGLITNLKEVALVTSSADCQSILLYDPVKKVIGNIHSGWKGTLNRIVINAIKKMEENYFCNVKDIRVYICPSIMQECFEVDEDVKDNFIESFKDIDINSFIRLGRIVENKQKFNIDTIGINKEVLKQSGVDINNIFSSDICTKCCCDKFYSHRGQSNIDGRNIALIMLK